MAGRATSLTTKSLSEAATMNNAAAFKASVYGLRTVASRKLAQIVLEIPIEELPRAMTILGTIDPSQSNWVAVARLVPSPDQPAKEMRQPDSSAAPVTAIRSERPKRAFRDMTPAQQAGMMCNDIAFQKFLTEKFKTLPITNELDAATIVRNYCQVNSRAEILGGTRAEQRWNLLASAYHAWQREPEYVTD